MSAWIDEHLRIDVASEAAPKGPKPTTIQKWSTRDLETQHTQRACFVFFRHLSGWRLSGFRVDGFRALGPWGLGSCIKVEGRTRKWAGLSGASTFLWGKLCCGGLRISAP